MAKIPRLSILVFFLLMGNNTCQNDLGKWVNYTSSTQTQNCKYQIILKNRFNATMPNHMCLNSSTYLKPNTTSATQRSNHVSCNKPLNTLNLVYSVFLVIVMIVAFLGNVFVCLVIARSRKLRTQSVFHLLFSLAVSDVLVSALSLPIKLHMGLHNQQFCLDIKVCWFYYITDIVANCSSVTHLLVISIQRFVAMLYPFDNHFILSRQRIDALIGLVWLYAILWSALCIFNWQDPSKRSITMVEAPMIRTCFNNNPIYWTVVWVAVFIIPLFVMGCLQASILHSVKSHTKKLLRLERDADKVTRMRRREIKVAKTVSIVYAAFTVCWLPVCLLTVTASWCNECFDKFRQWNPDVFVATFLVFTSMLPVLSSALNPFIYVISGDEFRKAIRTLFNKQKSIHSRLPIRNVSTDQRSSWV